MSYTISKIAVTGAGTMGAGIAQVFATSGYPVILFDLQHAQLDTAKMQITKNLDTAAQKGKITTADAATIQGRITFTVDMNKVIADLIIEAIIERLDAKQELLRQLAALNAPSSILASNTSSISITSIARGIDQPQRVVGMHFFNPAPLMKLVEVISGIETAPEVVDAVSALCAVISKTAIKAKDSPGFIVNRVARHYYVESLKLAEERVASMPNIDALLTSAGFKMGPFSLMDTIGNDINYAVTSSLYEAFHYEPKFRPSRLQRQLLDAGHLGKKSGRGFYSYQN